MSEAVYLSMELPDLFVCYCKVSNFLPRRFFLIRIFDMCGGWGRLSLFVPLWG